MNKVNTAIIIALITLVIVIGSILFIKPKLKFIWSSAGPRGQDQGYECVQIVESSDPHTWHDNYLCYKHYTFFEDIKDMFMKKE